MKIFTFLLIILLAVPSASGQQSINLQQKITNLRKEYSRITWQTEHFSKAGFHFNPMKSKNFLLKNALAIQKLDSVIYQEYISENEGWVNQWKDEYQYDSELRNSAWIEMEWNNTLGLWEDTAKTELELANDGQVSLMKYFIINDALGDSVLDSWSHAYYNEEGRLDSILHYYFETEASWGLVGRQNYHYNESGQLVQMDFESLEEDEGEEYMQTMRFIYTYNDAGQMATSGKYLIDAEMEILSSETEYIYDDSGRLVASELSEIKFLFPILELSSRTEYEYNATGDVLVETYLSWEQETEQWVAVEKYEYTYSNTSYSEVIFPSYLQFWGVNEKTNTFNYAVTEIVTSSNIENEWITTDRTSFYYSEGTTTNTKDLAKVQVSIFPNPATDNITLRWDGNKQLHLEVYQITGAKLFEKQVTSGMKITVSALDKGVYLYKLTDNNHMMYSGKLIKK